MSMDPDLREICLHEGLGMLTRRKYGYDQHDDHLWRWLNHRLRLWGERHPITVKTEGDDKCQENI